MTDKELMQMAEKQGDDVYVMGNYAGKGKVFSVTLGGVSFAGNGTAGREADVRPTGFFFQMPKPIGEVYGWHGSGKGQPMCRWFDTTEAEMPVGTKLYIALPQRSEPPGKPSAWVGLTNEDISEVVRGTHNTGSFVRAIETKLREKNSQHKEKNT